MAVFDLDAKIEKKQIKLDGTIYDVPPMSARRIASFQKKFRGAQKLEDDDPQKIYTVAEILAEILGVENTEIFYDTDMRLLKMALEYIFDEEKKIVKGSPK